MEDLISDEDLKKGFPRDGVPPAEMEKPDVGLAVREAMKANGKYPAAIDTILRHPKVDRKWRGWRDSGHRHQCADGGGTGRFLVPTDLAHALHGHCDRCGGHETEYLDHCPKCRLEKKERDL